MMIQVMSHVTTPGLFTFYKTSLKIFFYAVQYNEWVFFYFWLSNEMEIIPMFTFSLFPTSVYVIIVANDVKKTQNAYRRVHGSPDLRLDDHMMCDAQNYAQKMASKGVLEHQSSAILARRGVGENIGMSCVPARNGPLTYLKVQKMARNVAKRW